MIPYKISEQERTSIIRPVHHSFNVFHARRGAEGGTLVSPKARLGGRNSESTRQEQYYRDCHHDVPSCLFFFTCAHTRARRILSQIRLIHTRVAAYVYTSPQSLVRLCSCLLSTLACSHLLNRLQPSLYPSYLSTAPFFSVLSSSPVPEEERRPTSLSLPRPKRRSHVSRPELF